MPRQAVSKVEKNFSRGLITDVTALNFPENASTDTDNCVFDFTGRVTRRLGIDLEDGYVAQTGLTAADTDVYTEFLWEAVAGVQVTFAVIQKGSILYFFDVSTTTTLDDLHATIDLTDFLPADSSADPALYVCQYASGRGTLIVTNPVCDPFYILYDPAATTLTATAFEIEVRDFAGLDDGLEITERPTATVAGLLATNPEHYYNLLNQGWTTTDALAQWDAARTDMPSNADYVALYRASVTDAFDNARVLSLSPLSRPAPKGHFILTATNPDRDAAMVADGFSAGLNTSGTAVAGGIGTTFSSGVTSPAFAFDGVTNTDVTSCALLTGGAAAYIGKNYTSSPNRMVQAVVYGANSGGFVLATPSITFSLYAKQTAPTSATDGTLLGTVTFTDTANESAGRTISSSDTTTFWNYVWVKQDQPVDFFGPAIAEVVFYAVSATSTENVSTTLRPKSVAFFAGRLFYAGIEALALNNTIFFTQILEKEAQYGWCYSANDPTGEYFFDLLSSDGGTIVIPEIGTITKLVSVKNALIIISTNGVWSIQGSAGSYFRANDYQVKRISTLGSSSPLSVVDNQGLPMWVGQEGIYTLKFDQEYDTFSLDYPSVGVVDQFLSEIPVENKKYIKGVFSPEDYIIYWLFYDGVLSTDKYTYNRVLCYDTRTKAYYPWTFNAPIGTLDIRGQLFVQAADRIDIPSVKYVVTYNDGASLTFAQVRDIIHRDWFTFDDEIEDIDGAQEYDSYFITGYYLPGDAIRFAQGNYILTLLEQNDADDSCYVQGVYDYATNASSGKWSNRQEIYTGFMDDRSLTWRRLKLRGKGRSIQLRYSSNSTKPFTIIGWSLFISTSQGL